MKRWIESIALLAPTATLLVLGACSGGAGTSSVPVEIGNEDPGSGYGPGSPAPTGQQHPGDSGRPRTDTGRADISDAGLGVDSGSGVDTGGSGGMYCSLIQSCCKAIGYTDVQCNSFIMDCGGSETCCRSTLSALGCLAMK